MRRVLTLAIASISMAGIAGAQSLPKYTVVDLGILSNGGFSQAVAVSERRAGVSTDKDGKQQAMLWWAMFKMNIGKPGLNSGAFAVNNGGQVAVQAEVESPDPNNENFCAYGSGKMCRPFIWDSGTLRELKLLGGNNGSVGSMNNRGEIAGGSETGERELNCPGGVSVSGTGPQVLNFQAVVWGPRAGQIRKLPTLGEDTVGMATEINDHGQAVGATGTCANTVLPPLAYGPHAVLWEADGAAPRDLGNLGSTALNIALAINNKTQVVGVSSLYPDSSPFGGSHAFLWQQGVMRDLGTLPGDVQSVAQSINDAGQVTGVSIDRHGNPRPFVWRDGVMQDLNERVVSGAPIYLLFAPFVNTAGEIVGFGVTEQGETHAFLASPVAGESETIRAPVSLPQNLRELIGDGHGWFTLGIRRAR